MRLLNLNVMHEILRIDHNWHEKHRLQYKICDVINRAKIPQMSYFQSHLDVASDTGSSIFLSDILIVSKSTPFFHYSSQNFRIFHFDPQNCYTPFIHLLIANQLIVSNLGFHSCH